VQEALVAFKKSLLPTDNNNVRNGYIKMKDHRSQAIVHLVGILRTEALQEKMTLRTSGGTFSPSSEAVGPFFKKTAVDNSLA